MSYKFEYVLLNKFKKITIFNFKNYRYCLGLLLSTLRCQEEARLKIQCQNLLAVSRKLFMRLGICIVYITAYVYDSRLISNNFVFNE